MNSSIGLLPRGEDERQQEEEAAGRDHGRPPPRHAQDRLQLGARGGASARQPGAARQEPAGAAPQDAPRVEYGGDREHRDQGEGPPGPRRRRARRLLGTARGGDLRPALERPRPERGFVTVCRTVEEDDDGTLLQYPPKNGKARVVPLPAAACDELRVWLAAQKEYRLAQGPAWNEAGRVVPKKGNFLATCRRRSAAPLARLCSPLWPKDSRSQRTAHELRGLLSEATDRQRRMLRQGWPSATTPLTTHSTWAGSRARVSTST